MKKITRFIIFGFLVINLNSCVLLGAYAINQEAKYSTNLGYSVKDVYKVVLNKLLSNENITITKNIYSDEESIIEAKVDSRKYKGEFSIQIDELTDNSSTLTIKYNIFGDKVRSQEFLQSVREGLREGYYKNQMNLVNS